MEPNIQISIDAKALTDIWLGQYRKNNAALVHKTVEAIIDAGGIIHYILPLDIDEQYNHELLESGSREITEWETVYKEIAGIARRGIESIYEAYLYVSFPILSEKEIERDLYFAEVDEYFEIKDTFFKRGRKLWCIKFEIEREEYFFSWDEEYKAAESMYRHLGPGDDVPLYSSPSYVSKEYKLDKYYIHSNEKLSDILKPVIEFQGALPEAPCADLAGIPLPALYELLERIDDVYEWEQDKWDDEDMLTEEKYLSGFTEAQQAELKKYILSDSNKA
jgi:hypothetical protein